jgi:starch synthase (maltosyl-transferring)
LTAVVLYWAKMGIRIFRVDNPHTKPYRFWEYLIREVQTKYPDTIFLSEAFTKPKVMHTLAKLGFTQSYTYFTWRTSKQELIDYMVELSQSGSGAEYFRPNFWPNTPDINSYQMQSGQESLFLQRYFLAGTLSGNCGIYGPAYELMEHAAVPGKEEYLDSEKYELKLWDWDARNTVTYVITKVNESRKRHSALQQTRNIHFCPIDNDQILAYYKWDEQSDDHLLMVVNLDPYHRQEGWVQVPTHKLGVQSGHQLKMRDLMSSDSYIWENEWNYVALEPSYPFHLFKIEK